MTEAGMTAEWRWEFILTTLPTLYEVPEIDLKMLLIELILAVPLAIGSSLALSGMSAAWRRWRRSQGKITKPSKD